MRVVVNALTGLWNGLDGRRRGFLVGGVAALLLILVVLTRVATAPSYALLYAGLDPAAAGEVVTAIEARGIAYRVQGDGILVDVQHRDALRMSLAGEGLPANGAAGYELLDSLSGFGTTSQMFDAAYWRAKEGELARTIASSPRIRGARVHLANPGSDPFQPAQQVTASVALHPAAGGLAPGHAQALRFLVASSVPGLLPENVTVLDADSGQVLGAVDAMASTANAASRAEELRRNVERLLAARVGPGNAVVQVNVDLNTTRETIVERRIDPESRVVIATETEERNNTSRDADTGAGVTVASNLPDGDAANGGESSSQAAESRESTTFDISEVQRELEREPGDIRRITVAVLLNGVPGTDADGTRSMTPRPAEEIAALDSLVRSAIGYDAERGDAVTIDSMVFDESVLGSAIQPGFADRISLDLGRVLQTVVLSAAALFIAFGLLRPLLRRAPYDLPPMAEDADDAPPLQVATARPPASGLALSGPEQGADALAHGGGDVPAPASAGLPGSAPPYPAGGADTGSPDPVDRLRRLIEEREEETVEILRSWMEEDEEVRP
jgi:flagellar M-ring protein FliF